MIGCVPPAPLSCALFVHAALAQAVQEERYEDAAKLKAQLKALEAELGAAALDSGLLSTRSDENTRGVRVVVQSAFVPQVSARVHAHACARAPGTWHFPYHWHGVCRAMHACSYMQRQRQWR